MFCTFLKGCFFWRVGLTFSLMEDTPLQWEKNVMVSEALIVCANPLTLHRSTTNGPILKAYNFVSKINFIVWIKDFQWALVAPSRTLVSSLTAFEMSGLECLTKYNNIPTPKQYLVWWFRAHNNSLRSTRSLKISVCIDVLRNVIFKVLYKSWLQDMNGLSIFWVNQTTTKKLP
jgi:hypothetical protein